MDGQLAGRAIRFSSAAGRSKRVPKKSSNTFRPALLGLFFFSSFLKKDHRLFFIAVSPVGRSPSRLSSLNPSPRALTRKGPRDASQSVNCDRRPHQLH
jgi:hypothetical protein